MANEIKAFSQPLTLVVKVIDDFTIVINRGQENGVKVGDRFLVYTVEDEELRDPQTNESLGNLEIVRGTGTVIHVQEKLATIKSNRISSTPKTIRKSTNPFLAISRGEIIEEIGSQTLPFDNPAVKDRVKPI